MTDNVTPRQSEHGVVCVIVKLTFQNNNDNSNNNNDNISRSHTHERIEQDTCSAKNFLVLPERLSEESNNYYYHNSINNSGK